MLSAAVTTDETNSSNGWVIANKVDAIVRAVNHVDNSWWHASLQGKLNQSVAGEWDSLAWLLNISVTAHDAHWEHPERNHSRKIEWRNTSANAERVFVRDGVEVFAEIVRRLTEEELWRGTGVLDYLETSANVALGVGQSFTLLLGDDGSEFFHVVSNQVALESALN